MAAFFVQNSKTAQDMGYRTTRPATIYSCTAAARTRRTAESGQKGRKETQNICTLEKISFQNPISMVYLPRFVFKDRARPVSVSTELKRCFYGNWEKGSEGA